MFSDVSTISRSKSSSTNSTAPTPMNYKTHPEAIYTSRLLNYSNLPKPKNVVYNSISFNTE